MPAVKKIMVRKNFTDHEMRCPCCKLVNPDEKALDKLQALRDEFGMRMDVNSACRCPMHNEKVGGSRTSKHIATPHHASLAFDIDFTGRSGDVRYRFIQLAMKHGFNGIGLYNSFIHIDAREDTPAMWLG